MDETLVWRKAITINDVYIVDDALKDIETQVLITYQTRTGKRFVKTVSCSFGRIINKIGGRVIAWMPEPEPYRN